MTSATHFIAVYNVLCFRISKGKRIFRMDYNVTEPREMKYLEPFTKSVGDDMTAVFKIKLKATS